MRLPRALRLRRGRRAPARALAAAVTCAALGFLAAPASADRAPPRPVDGPGSSGTGKPGGGPQGKPEAADRPGHAPGHAGDAPGRAVSDAARGKDGGPPGHGAADAKLDGGRGASELAPGAEARFHEARRALGESRAERRKAEREGRKKELGAALADPAVRDELRLHAQRMARLTALGDLARAGTNDALGGRVAALKEKEATRHARSLSVLQAKAKLRASGGAPGAAPAGEGGAQ